MFYSFYCSCRKTRRQSNRGFSGSADSNQRREQGSVKKKMSKNVSKGSVGERESRRGERDVSGPRVNMCHVKLHLGFKSKPLSAWPPPHPYLLLSHHNNRATFRVSHPSHAYPCVARERTHAVNPAFCSRLLVYN